MQHSSRTNAEFDLYLVNGVRWSIIGHLALGTLVLLKSIFFAGEMPEYVPTLRVDMVALPDILKKDLDQIKPKSLNEPKKEAAAPAPVEPKSRPDEMALKKDNKKVKKEAVKDRKDQMKNALERIKALNKILNEDKADNTIVKGNKISPGISLDAEAREAAEANYNDVIREELRNNWELPVWLARQDYSAQVRIFINSIGRVVEFQFVRKSGNAPFDDAVRQAIQDSQPFPAPPEDVRNLLLVRGILLGFPL